VCGLGGKVGDSYSIAIDRFGDLRTGSSTLPAAQLGSVIVDNLGSGLTFEISHFLSTDFICMLLYFCFLFVL
jgi:hypothetical protein